MSFFFPEDAKTPDQLLFAALTQICSISDRVVNGDLCEIESLPFLLHVASEAYPHIAPEDKSLFLRMVSEASALDYQSLYNLCQTPKTLAEALQPLIEPK